MAYEHGSAGNRFDLPNPMKVENVFMAVSGGICVLLGLLLLFASRRQLEGSGSAMEAILTALALLVMGGTYMARTFSQLRFFFGRGRPQPLAPEVVRGKAGNSLDADALKESLRQQAVIFPEPHGPLNGILYATTPNLIYAPLPIQSLARQQFANAIKMLLMLLLLCVALVSGAASPDRSAWGLAQGWIGLGVLLYLLGVLFFSPSGAKLSDRDSQSRLAVKWVALRLVLAVVAPVALVKVIRAFPPLKGVSPFPHVFVLLLLAFVAYALIFFALLREGNAAPATAVSQTQEAWNLHCHPGLVVGEFDRIMQTSWREQIPNRVYTRLEPFIDPAARTGQFKGEMLEEYQPMPLAPRSPGLGESLREPKLRLLVGLTAFSSATLVLSGVCVFIWGLLEGSPAADATWMVYGLIMGSLAAATHRVSHDLWQRFDFSSVLVFCEMQGQYVTAELQHGNIMRDSLKATSSVTQIESMTFRLWVASLQTICFGKDQRRYIRAMQPESEAAKTLTDQLRTFAREQAIILAPSSESDRARQAQLMRMNSQEPPCPPTLGETPEATTPTARFCTSCGAAIIAAQRFCGACGLPAQNPT